VCEDATRLGRSPLRVRRLGFGCEQLGGYEWGAVNPARVAAAVEMALEHGITLFDTADCYGRGESERRLGRLLAPHRERVLIATKFGVRFSDAGTVWYDSSPQWIAQAVEESRRRLDTDVVDLLQMHYWDGITPVAAVFDALEALRVAGKIRWYGITNHIPHETLPTGYPGLVSASLEYSLVERRHEVAARAFAQMGLTFVSYGSLGQGILSGKYQATTRFAANDRRSRPQYRNFHGERLARNLRIVESLRQCAQQLGISMSQLAIGWILQQLPSGIALVGIKSPEQLQDLLGALTLRLPPQVTDLLEAMSATAETAEAGA